MSRLVRPAYGWPDQLLIVTSYFVEIIETLVSVYNGQGITYFLELCGSMLAFSDSELIQAPIF